MIAHRVGGCWLVELLLWGAVIALLSPLVAYAGRPSMPLAALYAVAAGIALALALAGRQLHSVLLTDGLSGRKSTTRLLLAAGMMLLVLLLVMVGAVIALMLLSRGSGLLTPDSTRGLP